MTTAPLTDDAEAAWTKLQNEPDDPRTPWTRKTAFLAGFAAGAARLDALHAGHDELTELYGQRVEEVMSLRAERDALHAAITALADEMDNDNRMHPQPRHQYAAELRGLSEAGERRE